LKRAGITCATLKDIRKLRRQNFLATLGLEEGQGMGMEVSPNLEKRSILYSTL
jgi:hypothetical protein